MMTTRREFHIRNGLLIANARECSCIAVTGFAISSLWYLLALLVLPVACAQQPPTDLAAALKGIEKSRFLACSGPPLLELNQSGVDRASFVTNLKRGEAIGTQSPTATPVASCSVSAQFETSRLVSAEFSGNQSMCQVVFSACLKR